MSTSLEQASPVAPLWRIVRRLSLPAAVLGALLLAGALAIPSLERRFLQETGLESKATLNLAVEGLRGALSRFEPMPRLMAERGALRALLRNPDDTALLAQVNEQLRRSAYEFGASDLFLIAPDAVTIAASNYLKEKSFIGRRFEYRPYVRDALQGGFGRYFALGTTSGERGYYFASPVMDAGEIVGALALKFTVDAFEAVWRGGPRTVLVTDTKGVIFMSSRQDWLFRSLVPLSDAVLAEIEQNRQYPTSRLSYLENEETPLDDGLSVLGVTTPEGVERYVAAREELSDIGWAVWTLSPAPPAERQALVAYLLFAMATVLGGALYGLVRLSRLRLRDRLEAHEATQAFLEQRVEERTDALRAANTQLRREVEERITAEQRLRETQDELVQAGKLAALGQMSAGLSHEINQPLAVVKSYAANTRALLDRRDIAQAQENISRISKMVDRVAGICGHLRNFARSERGPIGRIDVVAVIDEAVDMLRARFEAQDAALDYERPGAPVWVAGGRVRLQQVLVNLLGNALDAVDGRATRRIAIALTRPLPTRVQITVTDTGQGLPEDGRQRIFDPFFTTKAPGQGLGLGLSISYNIIRDFGGLLSASNAPEGGARFVVDLQEAETLAATVAEQGRS